MFLTLLFIAFLNLRRGMNHHYRQSTYKNTQVKEMSPRISAKLSKSTSSSTRTLLSFGTKTPEITLKNTISCETLKPLLCASPSPQLLSMIDRKRRDAEKHIDIESKKDTNHLTVSKSMNDINEVSCCSDIMTDRCTYLSRNRSTDAIRSKEHNRSDI